MATTRTAEVEWVGGLMDGEGKIAHTTSTKLDGLELSWPGRLDDEEGVTSPEELVAAGLSGCYAMSVAHTLVGGGWEPQEIKVAASLMFEPGRGIVGGGLTLQVTIDGEIGDDKLWEVADRAKLSCPVVNALSGVDLELDLPGVEKPVEEVAAEPELDEAPAE
jgi:osmotically inducible protein OsmC